MTNEEIMRLQAFNRAFAATDAGRAFVKFERALHTAVITDQRESASDAAMKRDWNASNAAREEAVVAIKLLQDQIAALRHVAEPHAAVAGTKPLVVYFATDADRDEFIAAMAEAKPNMRSVKL